MLHGPLLADIVGARRQKVLLHLRAFLFHGNLRVTEHILFLSQLRFRVKYLLTQIGILQRHDYVSRLDFSTLLNQFVLHDTRFKCRYLHYHAGLHMTVDTDKVIEHSPGHIASCHRIGIHFVGGLPHLADREYHCRYYQHRNGADNAILLNFDVFVFYFFVHRLIRFYLMSFSPL